MATILTLPDLSFRTAENGLDFARNFYPSFSRIDHPHAGTLRSLVRETDSILDFDALNVFLRIGTFVGTDTAFRHIKADPPDYDWATGIRPTELSRPAVIDAYIDLFRSAVARCGGQDDICLPLSGGQDSRHILLELASQGRKPHHCLTVDIPWAPREAEIAGELCQTLDIPHRIFVPKGDINRAETNKNALTDYSSLQHGWMAEAVLAGLVKNRVIFDGIAGDVLSRGHFLNEARLEMLAYNRIDELVEDIIGPQQTLFGIDDHTLFPRWRAVEKVNEEFRKHLGAPDPIASFYFWNRTRRDVGCSAFRLLRHSAKTVHMPYLDSELCRFLASLSPRLTAGQTLHAETIAAAYPQFAHIPYAKSGVGKKRAVPFFRRMAVAAIGYVLRNDCPILSRRKTLARLARAVVSTQHAGEALFLAPQLIYLTQLFAEAAH